MATIPERDQLEALIEGRTWDLAVRFAGGDHQALLGMLTVTLEQLVAFAREHGLPETWVHRAPGSADGLYLIEDDDGFAVYSQERGRPEPVVRFESETAALEHLIATHYMPHRR